LFSEIDSLFVRDFETYLNCKPVRDKTHTIKNNTHMEQLSEKGIQHRFITAGGIRFHFLEYGKGPKIVLIAGFPQSCYAWRRVIPLLAKHYKVIAIDLPGQGDSDKPIDGYDTKTTVGRVMPSWII